MHDFSSNYVQMARIAGPFVCCHLTTNPELRHSISLPQRGVWRLLFTEHCDCRKRSYWHARQIKPLIVTLTPIWNLCSAVFTVCVWTQEWFAILSLFGWVEWSSGWLVGCFILISERLLRYVRSGKDFGQCLRVQRLVHTTRISVVTLRNLALKWRLFNALSISQQTCLS
jgi:hypothetical protein